jgi:hypothetical protein
MTHLAEFTEEGGAAVLRRDSDVEKGPPWSVTASEVTGGRRSGGVTQVGCLARTGEDSSGALGGLNARTGKRKTGKSRLGRARKGKRGGDLVRVTPRGGRRRTGPASWQLRGSGGDGRWSGGVQRRAGAGERATCVGCARSRGTAGERKALGRARENSADFDLKRISKLNTI